MKNGIVRFAALYVFNVVVLLLIGLLFPNVSVGLHALWASVVLTLAALFVKPVLGELFHRSTAKVSANRTRANEKAVQYALVYGVELIMWVLTVWLSGTTVTGLFWGYVLPPLFLLISWMVYDQVDDRLRAKAGQVYDSVQARVSGGSDPARASTPESPATAAGRDKLKDCLRPEQRRMLD